jgi:hypothetical protein
VPRDTIELTTPRIYRREGAYRNELLSDGRPLDAGSAMLLANELNWLVQEAAGPRQLVNDSGPGAIVLGNSDWNDLNEVVPPASERTSTAQEIAWAQSTARCYGPFAAVIDRRGEDGVLYPRNVRVAVRAKGDGSNPLKLYVAITATRRPPSDGYIDMHTATITAASEATLFDDAASDLEMWRLPTVARTSPAPLIAHDGDGEPTFVPVSEFYVWFAWKASGASPAYVTTLSAWELPPA